MGRYYDRRKATAEESYSLEISYLRKLGLLSHQTKDTIETIVWPDSRTRKSIVAFLKANFTETPHIIIVYFLTDTKNNITDYVDEISLVTTPCNFGGVRYWFICSLSKNGVYCGRRVGVLYLPPGSNYFGCRHCHNLSYNSRNESNIFGILGVINRKKTKLYSEIKRWTWRGVPTRKVRKLNILERKESALCLAASAIRANWQRKIKHNNP